MKTRPPLKTKPEFSGVNQWRTASKDKLHCIGCRRFATHVGLYINDQSRVFMCPTHSRIYTTKELVRRVEPMAEYKRYLTDMEQWKLQQQTAEQGVLL